MAEKDEEPREMIPGKTEDISPRDTTTVNAGDPALTAPAQQMADDASADTAQSTQPASVQATESPATGILVTSSNSDGLAQGSEPATASTTPAVAAASEPAQEPDGLGGALANDAQAAGAVPAADTAASSDGKSKPSVPVIPVSEEALTAASAAVEAHHSSPEKVQPATNDKPPPETPQSVKTMTGVAEGFVEPQDASKQSAADVVAAAVADSAPSPTSQEFSTFQEAVDDELKMAKAASDAAKALGEPGTADDILAQMTMAAASPKSAEAAKAAQDGPQASAEPPAAAAAEMAVAAGSPSPQADSTEPKAAAKDTADSAPSHVSPPAPSAAVIVQQEQKAAAGELPAAPLPSELNKAFAGPSEVVASPTASKVASDSPFAKRSSAASASPASASPSPEAVTPNGTTGMANGEPRSPSNSVASKIALLKFNSTESTGSPKAPADLPPASPSTPSSAVKSRLAAFRTNSNASPGGSPFQPPSPSTPPTRKWSVEGIDFRSTPAGPPATGEVVEEDVQPKKALKSFWESKSPGAVVSPSFQRPSNAEASNSGKKWQVKLNMPLASGKVSDLSFFKPKNEAAQPDPVAIEYKHKIGEATFPIEELRGMGGDDGIDPSNKEMYLTGDEFQTAFGMEQDAYKSKPKWRQVLLKKKAGLF